MAVALAGTSSQYLKCTAPLITAFPFTVCAWAYPTVVGGSIRILWNLTNNAQSLVYWNVYVNASSQWAIESNNTAAAGGTAVANAWAFTVARCISATNKRLAVLNPDGSTTHIQQTTSATPSSINEFDIGAFVNSGNTSGTTFWDGSVGEFWYTNSDIQPGGTQLSNQTLRMLAFGGPFAMPHVAKDIIEYRSFYSELVSDSDKAAEIYAGAKGRASWTNVNAGTLAAHPPLPGWYAEPWQNRKTLVM